MPNLDFSKPVTLTFHDGSVYTFIRGIWCDTNGIPCDERTSQYMQDLLDFAEWEKEENILLANPLDF